MLPHPTITQFALICIVTIFEIASFIVPIALAVRAQVASSYAIVKCVTTRSSAAQAVEDGGETSHRRIQIQLCGDGDHSVIVCQALSAADDGVAVQPPAEQHDQRIYFLFQCDCTERYVSMALLSWIVPMPLLYWIVRSRVC